MAVDGSEEGDESLGGVAPAGFTPVVGGFIQLEPEFDYWSVQRLDAGEVVLEAMKGPGVIRERRESLQGLVRCEPPVGRSCFALIDGLWVEGHLLGPYESEGERRWTFTTRNSSQEVEGANLRFHTADFKWSPADALGNWIVDTPGQFELRRRFLDELNFQRALTGGCTALMASKVEIYAHQVEIVARVLEDPIHRFILADEVGLGKTIEAGLILRQRFLDGRAKSALIIVPDHLQGQWQSELQDRFELPCSGMAVRVETFAAVLEGRVAFSTTEGAEPLTDLIVDEAHHAAAWGMSTCEVDQAAFNCLAELASRVDGLLLLSATPQETTAERLLALLELLDPGLHSREQLGRFQSRLALREKVVNVITLMDAGMRASYYAANLRVVAESQEPGSDLDELIRSVLSAIEDDREVCSESLASLRTHFRESFRIHNRLIRSSRQSNRLEAWRAPNENGDPGAHLQGMCRAPKSVDQRQRLDELAQDWRLRALQFQLDPTAAGTLLSGALFAACMGPDAMNSWVKLRRGQLNAAVGRRLFGQDALDASRETPEQPWEGEILDEWSSVAEGDEWFASKARATRDAVRELALRPKDSGHVVIFTSTSGSVERLEAYLSQVLQGAGGHSIEVIGLGDDAGTHEVMDASAELREDASEAIRVVVAGPRVAEGANLQGAHRVVHFDVPRNLPALEQRIGRLDRIGQSRTLRQILLLPGAEDSHASQFVQDVLAAFGVFSESISGVQGSAEEHLRTLDSVLIDSGKSMAELRPHVRGELQKERGVRGREREIDQAAVADWRAGVDFAALIEHERRVTELARTASQPLKKFLGLRRDDAGPDGSYRRDTATQVDLGAEHGKALAELLKDGSEGTFDRQVAAREPGLALRRIGDPLIDWSERFFLQTGRGSAYALIRQLDAEPWRAGQKFLQWPDHDARWVFSFEVAPRVEASLLRDHVRVRRYMPRREAIVLLGEAGNDADRVDIAWADEGFSAEPQLGALPLDAFNLRQQPFRQGTAMPKRCRLVDHQVLAGSKEILEDYISSSDWSEGVRRRADRALDALTSSPMLAEARRVACERFEGVSREHERVLRMRQNGEPGEEVRARDRILASLRSPTIRLRSAGLVILTGASPGA